MTLSPPSHEAGEAVCAYCGVLNQVGSTTRCSHCGAGLRVLEPLVVECGWCDASNRRDLTDTCTSCGGPLPALPGGNPGPRPPSTPRTLPSGYERRISYTKNVLVLIGICFTVCFFWTVLFALIGIPLWIKGKRNAERKLDALRNGVATRGVITYIEVDSSQSINERHPWRIDYSFDLLEGTFHGVATAWDPASSRRSAGDALWVVVSPADTSRNAIWPPIH